MSLQRAADEIVAETVEPFLARIAQLEAAVAQLLADLDERERDVDALRAELQVERRAARG